MCEDEVVLLSDELKGVHALQEAHPLPLSTDSDSEKTEMMKANDHCDCS